MGRAALRVVLVLAAMLCAAPLGADEPLGGPPAPERQKKAKRPAKDPVAQAFMLPRGVVLTPKQAEAYRQVRRQLEPLLRSALERVQSATGQKDKLKAVAEVKQIKEQIRQSILEILRNPSLGKSKDTVKKSPAKKGKRGKKKGGKKKGGKNKGGKKKGGKKKNAGRGGGLKAGPGNRPARPNRPAPRRKK